MRQGKLFFEEMAYQRLDKGKDPLVYSGPRKMDQELS